MPITPLRPSDPPHVGQHRLLARLGQGGMGTVYLGVSPDARAVAVKVLRDGLTDPDARRRFRRELVALRRVRGPHLVEVLDADVDAELPYLVTRFVPGQRLDDLVQTSGPLPLEPLRRLARGLADALAVLHCAGVVHRDLTPGNVLVLDGQPHVIDLGLATAADVTAMTRSGLVIGTPGYLAPEQVTGRDVGPAADVHAWGATVALAGTGRPPYGTGRPEAMLYRIVHEAPDLVGLPEPLNRMVREAMSPDPARRPTAAALLAELGGPTAVEPVTVHLPRDVDATRVLTAIGWAAGGPDEQATRTLTRLGPGTSVAAPGPTLTRTRPSPVSAGEASTSTLGPVPPGHGPEPEHRPGPPPQHLPGAPQHLPGAPQRERGDGGLSAVTGDAPVPRPSHARSAQVVVTSVACLALVGATTLVAPTLGAAGGLGLLVALRAVGRGSDRLRTRRERRGGRRRDPMVATLGAPWHLALGALDTLVSLPLLLVVAALPAGIVWLADPAADGFDRPELTVATATVIGLATGLHRQVHQPSRRLLRNALVTATPGAASALAVLLAVVAIAAVLLATAQRSAPYVWPLALS